MRRLYSICMIIAALFILSVVPVICQEAKEADKETAATVTSTAEVTAPAVQEVNKEATVTEQAPAPEARVSAVPAEENAAKTNDVSIYGEVQAVDPTANSINVQYYDYDSDEEKTITLTGDNNTKFENAALLNDEIKGNWVDAIYTVSGGKNIAKLVSVEKEEEAPAGSPSETPSESAMDE